MQRTITETTRPRRPVYRLRPDVRRQVDRMNIGTNGLARRCGLSTAFVSQLLTGQRGAGPGTRRKLLQALPEFTFDTLFEEVEG